MPEANPVLVEITRGRMVESCHRGAAAVIDSAGRTVAAWGDVAKPVYPRSAVKPLQALPLVASGAADAGAVTPAELALACASHAGEPAHVQAVGAWLRRLGLGPDDLVCGAHPPLGEAAAADLIRRGQPLTRLHNNCSGKHAGFLTLARHLGAPSRGYADPQHPVQRLVLATLAEMAACDRQRAVVAVDGCGVPVMAMPLAGLAGAFALLVAPERLGATRTVAARRICAAMTTHPGLIGGSGRFDTLLVEAGAGGLIVKSGAEGVICAGLPGRGLGFALKIDDGGKRAAETAMAALLLHFTASDGGLLRQALQGFTALPVRDTRGEKVGSMRPSSGWPG